MAFFVGSFVSAVAAAIAKAYYFGSGIQDAPSCGGAVEGLIVACPGTLVLAFCLWFRRFSSNIPLYPRDELLFGLTGLFHTLFVLGSLFLFTIDDLPFESRELASGLLLVSFVVVPAIAPNWLLKRVPAG